MDCQKAEPVVDELKNQYGDKVEFVNVGSEDQANSNETKKKYGVQVLPTVVIVDGSGKVLFAKAGFKDAASYKTEVGTALENAAR